MEKHFKMGMAVSAGVLATAAASAAVSLAARVSYQKISNFFANRKAAKEQKAS